MEIRAVAEPVRAVAAAEPAQAAVPAVAERRMAEGAAAAPADQALVPGQPGAPDAERTHEPAQTHDPAVD